MKKVKFITLTATALLSIGFLTACGNDSSDNGSSDTTEQTTEEASNGEVTAGATANPTTDFSDLEAALSATGEHASWIGAITADVDAAGETLTVEGHFEDPHGTNPARKLALYSQDADHNVTHRYTLTVEKLVVKSPGFFISNGTIKGDVYVDADGFKGQTGDGVEGQATIDGNLYFATQAQLDAFKALDEADTVKVTGHVEVGTP